MANSASRVRQIQHHVVPPVEDFGTFEGISRVQQRGPNSRGPRAVGKVVIITGCNSVLGIGRATAHQYANNDARAVYLCDYASNYLDVHKREMNELFPSVDVHTRVFDAADEASVKEVTDDAIRRYGRLDVFFANAAVSGPLKLFTEFTVDEFESVMRTNSTSVFLAAKHSAPAMQITSKDKPYPNGSIICTSSTAGLRANAGSVAYSASKAAVISVVQTVCFQLAGTNVRCNAILPGMTETGMTAPFYYEPARRRGTENKIGQLCPLRRGAVADEIARVALFLGTDEASYVTGQTWGVDGGLTAGLPYKMGSLA